MAVGQRLRELDDRVLGPRGSLDLRRPVRAVRGGPATLPDHDPETGPTRDRHRAARHALALLGAVASVGLLAAYYVPGMRAENDLDGVVLLLSVPAAALSLPFVLLAVLLRVRAVWLTCGLLMLLTVASLATDLYGEPGDGSSLLGFFLLFVLNLGLLGLGLVVDVAVRGARRVVQRQEA